MWSLSICIVVELGIRQKERASSMKEKIYKTSCFIKDKEWLIALILNTVVMLFAFVFYTPVHETNDDVFLRMYYLAPMVETVGASAFVNGFL